MDKSEASAGIQKLNAEIMSLNPSAIITFFEIDATSIVWDSQVSNIDVTLFRFHNTVSLFSTDIYWQGVRYVAAPITANGFDLNSKGAAAVPILSISVNDAGVPALAQFKNIIRSLGDVIGAKVTRKRTLAKYLDDANFYPAPLGNANDGPPPVGFGQDWTVEFPDDVFYIVRKSNENKYVLEYELGSALDVDAVQLPGRLVSSQRCMFSYRGPGCFYEYKNRYNAKAMDNSGSDVLRDSAPPVATSTDTLISGMLGIGADQFYNQGEFDIARQYRLGDFVYLTKNGLNYYYVSRGNIQGVAPPDVRYWVHDSCSKLMFGCGTRFLRNGFSSTSNQILPFGGFPTVGKYSDQ